MRDQRGRSVIGSGWAAALVAALLVALLAPRARAGGVGGRGDDHDLWYVLELSGKRAGWMHTTQKTEGDRVLTMTEMHIEVGRGPQGVQIAMRGESVETGAGKPVSMKKVEQMGTLPVTTDYFFEGDKIRIVSEQNGKKTETTAAAPEGAWLTPAQAGDFVMKRLQAGAKEIVVRSMDPLEAPRVSVATHKIEGQEDVEAVGRTIPAVKWRSTLDTQPGVEVVEDVDEKGIPIRTEADLGGIKMVVLLADHDLAMLKIDPPELLVSTLVKPDRPIAGARRLKAATFLLATPGDKLLDVPGTSVQRAERLSESQVRVRVDLASPAPAPESEAGDKEYLASSSMVNAADPRIQELVKTATSAGGGGAGAEGGGKAARAEAMRRYVYNYISKKDLAVGFATASEVAQTKAGDCSEHGVLLCAMLRADGIPARVASGLIYADSFAGREAIFGYHMWAQAILEVDGKKTWVDLDGTLPEGTPFDATHIVLATSALGDGQTQNTLVALAPSLGKLKITVEATK